MALVPKTWTVYLLKCSDTSLYCGVTNNLAKRLTAHAVGKGAKYTRSRLPVVLAASRDALSKQEAFRLEYRIKQLPTREKMPALQSWES